MREAFSVWEGLKRVDFKFEGMDAIVIFPEEGKENGKWLLKTEYFGAFPNFEIEMVKKGWHLAYVQNSTRWCRDEDLDLKKEFAEFVSKKYSLDKKCIPVGMSCGGMIAVKFAAKYPDYVSCLYLDAPVMNLLSCPGDLGIGESGLYKEFYETTGITISELICYREHPMDKLPELVKSKIPTILVYGKADMVVPYVENGAMLEKCYRRNNIELVTIGKEDCGHHPHGLEDPAPIIEFVEKYA